jgi:RNA polymerase sigma factor (sigma-70 family)
MSHTLPRIDPPGDAELISAVRGGDLDAYGDLFERHVGAARALARQLVSSGDADDLVSDAFAKVLAVLQRGGGPDVAFRAYLLTAIRRLHIDKIRAGSKVHTTDDMDKFDPGTPFRDTAVEGFENAAAAAAFSSLPERWQLVLWHTEVEGQKPAEVGLLLGMSANSVSALAYRAREGLRQAYLNSHAQELDDATCRWTHNHLGAYVRNGVSRRDAAKVEEHLDDCRRCTAIYLELIEVNSNLAGILGPLLLGGAATGYVAALGAGAAVPTGLAALLGNVRSQLNPTVAGVVAATVVAGGIAAGAVAMNSGNDGNKAVVGSPPAASQGSGNGGQDAGSGTGGTTSDTAPATPAKPAPEKPAKPPTPKKPVTPARKTLPTPAAAVPASPAEPVTPMVAPPPPTPAAGPNPSRDGIEASSAPNPDAPTQAPPKPEPTPDPTPPPPPPPPKFDLVLEGVSVDPPNGGNDPFRLVATMSGLSPGGSATLTIVGDSRLRFRKLDAACTPIDNGASCTITTTPSSLEVAIEQFEGDMPVTFTLAPNGDTEDVNPDNNQITV